MPTPSPLRVSPPPPTTSTTTITTGTTTKPLSLSLSQYPPPNPLTSSPCPLYLDILELILDHHRTDPYTLTALALTGSHLFLHLARKLLYRSISLDYCENPYAYESQRALRRVLAGEGGEVLCAYVGEVRVRLSGARSGGSSGGGVIGGGGGGGREDVLVGKILSRMKRVERVHIVGGGMGGVQGRSGSYHHGFQRQPFLDPTNSNFLSMMDSEVGRGLEHLFGLETLKKVTLENVAIPYSDLYISLLGPNVKCLEVLSVESPSEYGYPSSTRSWPRSSLSLRGSSSKRKKPPQLETLILNMDQLQPPFVFVGDGSENEEARDEDSECSVLDLSKLKQVHLYVWDQDDGDVIWGLLDRARETLEVLTLRYFHTPSSPDILSQGFQNLHTLIVGTPAFATSEDPFRGLIQLFSNPLDSHLFPSSTSTPSSSLIPTAFTSSTSLSHIRPSSYQVPQPRPINSKFPSLRTLKVIFDLWSCEASRTSWRSLRAYRGWGELDDVLGRAFPSSARGSTAHPSSSTDDDTEMGDATLKGDGRLMGGGVLEGSTRIIFEIQCSARYREVGGGAEVHPYLDDSHAEDDEEAHSSINEDVPETRAGGNAKPKRPPNLLDCLKNELYNLRNNPYFMIL
ncbi:hypothetical protein CC1G_08789 [Coprinopsis cinerea okayama7|uniref:Uncharacterized protein n=1 Tax=Coprinopsis cinerea (strain Okayama-7 / 130 / ATCC MYA-4618 / FGSC 9003) TaxID=240176 RepID=A8N439_COPC7|nr:hypothetical protein CC1G_08789 [Coprinopsis cinerea okayama7\|eukprot:XP_001829634.1 hypothetical protein CC1G_08789 [Coprinopsis cinerea okayama7\